MRIRSVAPPPAAGGRTDDGLAAARGIGERLVREAIWYRGQCNWIGVASTGSDGGAGGRQAHRALGPSLGDGTAGIALFLAQLHAATGSDAAARTARGAIAQALAHAGDAAGRGLYDGRPGIALAAAHCGRLLGDERTVARAARLAAARTPAPTGASDLATGAAGAIVALLALARLHGDGRLRGRVARLGDELVAAARRSPVGWCWPPAPGRHGLCGMARGAAGVAWALLELSAATGDARHRAAAERALDYERHWFDPARADWPDLRGIERREPQGSFEPPYATGWCHGAAGIALSRLRAWQLLGEDALRAEALTALTTTAAQTERALLAPRADFTLGHGLAGHADVLLLGAALLPEAAALARRVAEVGVGRYATSLDGWPCGTGCTPALLTGEAGIGWFLLRLRDPAVPSVLLALAPPG